MTHTSAISETFDAVILPDASRIRGIDFFVRPTEENNYEPGITAVQGERLCAVLAVGADCAEGDLRDLQLLQESLPEMYLDRYTPQFQLQFEPSIAEVRNQLENGWVGANCIADELALHLIIERAMSIAEGWGVTLPRHLGGELFASLIGDDDYVQLYNGALWSETVRSVLGARDYRFECWFEPYPR